MYITFGKKLFGIIEYGDSIYVEDMDSHKCGKVPVRDSDEFVYKCNKKSISAINGIHGLTKFMSENSKTENTFSCHVKNICEFVISRGM